MGGFEHKDSDSSRLLRGQAQPQGPQDYQWKEIEGRHEVGESTGSTALQNIDGILKEIFLASVCHDLDANQKSRYLSCGHPVV